MDLAAELGRIVANPGEALALVVLGWVVRAPLVSREEGHEAITRAAWAGLGLSHAQKRALIRGVRAPDVSLAAILTLALPLAQPRHALRAWSGTTVAEAIQQMRAYLVETHRRAVSLADGPPRWRLFGEALHCIQDSYSPAHVDRAGGRILQVRHWGPLDALRRARRSDEHGFPIDRRDGVWHSGQLTPEAQAAAAASRSYLELAMRPAGESEPALAAFLDLHTGT